MFEETEARKGKKRKKEKKGKKEKKKGAIDTKSHGSARFDLRC